MILRNIMPAVTCALLLLNSLHCANQTAGVETTNGAVVTVHAQGVYGTTPPYTLIYLFDKNYIPFIDSGLGVSTVADMDGKFSFTGIKIDTISMTLISSDFTDAAYVKSGAAGGQYQAELNSQGAVRGNVTALDSGRILVFLQGTAYYTLLSGTGPFEISSLPKGTYALKAATLTKIDNAGTYSVKSISLSNEVIIESGEIVNVSVTIP